MRVHKLQNVENALNFLKKVKKINIRNDEIVDGNPKLILGLLWTLILHFQEVSLYTSETGQFFGSIRQLLAMYPAMFGR